MHSSPIVAALLMSTLIFNTLALSSCDSSDAGKSDLPEGTPKDSPSFTVVNCLEMTSPDVVANILQNDSDITCGRVSVPANWENPDANMIELAVYRVAPTNYFPKSDPVVVLAGGPGQPGIGILLNFVDGNVAYLRKRSEIIVVDQRGTGFSTPSLACPAATAIIQGDNTKTIEDYYAAKEKALLACAENLERQNVDLADYTTANNARDIDAIRQALAIDQWNLFGGSYGTTLALTIMRDWPHGVRSAVLDSAVPLQANILSDKSYAKGYWPISRIVTNCKADADCNEILGDIQPLIEAGITRLATSPIGILNANQYILEILAKNIGGPDITSVIRALVYLSDEEIEKHFQQNTESVDSATDAPSDAVYNDPAPPPVADTPPWLIPTFRAEVMFMSIVCAEEIPYPAVTASPDISSDFQQTTRDVIDSLARISTYSDGFCEKLGVPPAEPIESQAVHSDLPVLILAGDTDSDTPLAWSQRTAETLHNSQYVEFPRAGHVLTAAGFDCSADMLLSFLDAPGKAVDRGCVNALPLVDYHIWTEPEADIVRTDEENPD